MHVTIDVFVYGVHNRNLREEEYEQPHINQLFFLCFHAEWYTI